MSIRTIATTPFAGQKPGTSGLRKKVSEVVQPHYLENFVQSIFYTLSEVSPCQGATLVLGGDGRYHNSTAIQMILKMSAANGVGRVLVGQGGILSTPAVSVIIREREGGVAHGGIILTASHNPGGPENDFGIKYNTSNGGPALEDFTNKIYEHTLKISSYILAEIPDVNLNELGSHTFHVEGRVFTVEIIDSAEDYVRKMQQIFNFEAIRGFLQRPDFSMAYDCMHGVSGPYVRKIFGEILGVPQENLMNSIPLEDFGGGHPDPNLVYAHDLVVKMGIGAEQPGHYPDFGAANDGDADRNMVLGKQFFVTPSDSLAVIVAHARCIPYFSAGLKGVARSMPTSMAVDAVAKELGIQCYEVPTGWKVFGNLMDADRLSICGEESFGTGSDHIREKDGVWAVLAWLSILAHKNQGTSSLVSVEQILKEHWNKYGRNYYIRYDYENCDTDQADRLMAELKPKFSQFDGHAEVFSYTDPVDGSVSANQGIIFRKDNWRVIYRLSGTGSVGATIRVYYEKNNRDNIELDNNEALQDVIQWSLQFSNIQGIIDREEPTVIT